MRKSNGFYDLHVETVPDEFSDTIEIAKKLGWSGIGLIFEENDLNSIKDVITNNKDVLEGMDVSLGIKIIPRNSNEISKKAKKLRRRVELIFVQGGVPDINRAALETPEVDVLLKPWSKEGCGINQVLAKIGRKNNVAISFGMKELVYSYKKTRANILSNIEEAARFVKKFKCPFILSSDAASAWDLRSASELMSLGRVLGFGDPEIKKSLSSYIVKENRKRLYGKWIMPGVEII